MSYELETIPYKGCTIKLISDDDAPNPRTEWDNVGTMLCRHSRYNLGDGYKNGKGAQPSAEDIIEITKRDDVIWLPLYLYDHSGITMRSGAPSVNWTDNANRFAGDGAGWDTSTVGIIYCTKERAVKEWGRKRYTKAVEKKAIAYLEGEVKDYASYLEGDVIGFVAEDPDGNEIQSCWGFFPDDRAGYGKRWAYPIGEAESAIDGWIEKHENFVHTAVPL